MDEQKQRIVGLILPEEERVATRWWTVVNGEPPARIKIPFIDDDTLKNFRHRAGIKAGGQDRLTRAQSEKLERIILTECQLEWEAIARPESPDMPIQHPTDEDKLYIGSKLPRFSDSLLKACMDWEDFASSMEEDRKK